LNRDPLPIRAAPFLLWPYHVILRARNQLYDQRILPSHSLNRWTISVGNISFGGTGKTPVVIWLAEELKKLGHYPAVLLRGYRATNGQSDEATLLSEKLPGTAVIANPDRIAGAAIALTHKPPPDIFLLDDGMQHRRVRRDIEIVLINAADQTNLLREPLAGLRRATAIVLTHTAENPQIANLESSLRRHNPTAAIFHCDHVHLGLLNAQNQPVPMDSLAQTPFVAVCAIGNPRSFFAALPAKPLATRALPDHDPFSPQTVGEIQSWAKSLNAAAIVVTEKDWTKLAKLPTEIPILRVVLGLRFRAGEDQKLLDIARPKS